MSRRVLVISYTALMANTANGRTMQSLLQGIPAENISLFCCQGIPDVGSCGSCYKISNLQALKSLFFLTSGDVIDMNSQEALRGFLSADDQRKGSKTAWKYLIKEIVWHLKGWKNKAFKTWLRERAVDCVLYMYGDQSALQKLAVYAAQTLNVPLIVYSCEDYCMKDYNYIDKNEKSISFKYYQSITNRATKRLLERADALITNSDELGEAYRKKYGIQNIITVMMASQMEYIDNGGVKVIDDVNVDFLGALGDYRIKALMEIGEALQEIDPRLKLNVYGKLDNELLRLMLENCPGIDYKGFVSYETVQEVMRRSTLLVEAINDDPYIQKDKQHGFSTKYADSFACGTPFFVYAPASVVETVFAQKHNCAFVVSCKEELIATLKSALFDRTMRSEKLKAAKQVTESYFNKEKNINAVNLVIENLISKYRM